MSEGQKTRHPCSGRSPAQVEIFEAIATGQTPPLRPRSLAALVRDGLVEKVGMKTLGHDALGAIEVAIYEVPLPVHMQWCQWCAENVAEEV